MTGEMRSQHGVEPSEWQDEPDIGPDERLLRVVKSGNHVTPAADGRYIISDQLWRPNKNLGCSVELVTLFEKDHLSIDQRIQHNGGFGSSVVQAKAVRALSDQFDTSLKIAYTPILQDEPYGPNPYHCDIFPKFGKPANRDLTNASVSDLDQNKAHDAWVATRAILGGKKT